jgi:lipopolysaccharide assembly outer membrane protein LptD (OstA)
MKGIQEMICTGHVEIEQDKNKSYAEKAVYKAGTQKLTLSGRPKLILQTEGGSLFAASGN